MSDRVVVMDKGVIQQVGDPETIYARPANTFVANFIGVANLLEGKLVSRNGELSEVEIPLGEGRASLNLKALGGGNASPGQRIVLSLRPEDITLHLQPPAAESRVNMIEAEVIDTVYLGSFLDCRVRAGRHEVDVQIDHFVRLTPAQKVFLTFRPDHGLCLTD
jgi:ABC-type Fe3+/spermidine/putrescine transport system ATPase subunit